MLSPILVNEVWTPCCVYTNDIPHSCLWLNAAVWAVWYVMTVVICVVSLISACPNRPIFHSLALFQLSSDYYEITPHCSIHMYWLHMPKWVCGTNTEGVKIASRESYCTNRTVSRGFDSPSPIPQVETFNNTCCHQFWSMKFGHHAVCILMIFPIHVCGLTQQYGQYGMSWL